MTRKQMIEFCVNDQIARGIVKPEKRNVQVSMRLKGCGAAKPMSYSDCLAWYESTVNANAASEN